MRIAVVGGGILGVAVANRLTMVRPDAQVTLLEKEHKLAAHQTGHNSGVVHAGIYYAPGSLKAQLCRRGVGLLRALCVEEGIAYDECGKLVIALTEDELPRLDELERRATANGVPGLRRVSATEIREIEPHAVGVAGLHSPETAIVDFVAVTHAIADRARQAGAEVLTGREVTGISRVPDGVVLRTADGDEWPADLAVVCGGLQSDRLAVLAGDSREPQIVPFRGEYYQLRPDRRHLVRGLIYPVPDPRFPFLGIHLTKRHDGEVLVGPNAVLALAREGYRWRQVKSRDLAGTLGYKGFRKLARRYWRTGAAELWGSLSKRAFVSAASEYVPSLRADDVVHGLSGVRAQALDPDGSLVDDFRLFRRERVLAVRNAPSPGATSSLAIAEYVVDQLLEAPTRS